MDISDITVDTAHDDVRTRTHGQDLPGRGERPGTPDTDTSGAVSPRVGPTGFGTLLGNPRRIRL